MRKIKSQDVDVDVVEDAKGDTMRVCLRHSVARITLVFEVWSWWLLLNSECAHRI